MRDFDGDISKLATHRQKPEREFRQEYATGGLVSSERVPVIDHVGTEHMLPKHIAERMKARFEELQKERAPGKTVTFPIVMESSKIREIALPIIRKHLGDFIKRKLWEACDGKFPFMLAPQPQRLVVIESPFGHPTKVGMEENAAYARRCMLDSLSRNEAPYASHLLYTQCLDDLKTAERKQGMEAGFAWGRVAQHVAVYTDRGVSRGMIEGIKRHQATGKTIEFRSIDQ